MDYDRYSSDSVKLLTDWIVENMHETLRNSTPTTPIDIPPSKLLDNIINTNSEENIQKIIREALKQALISIKGEDAAKLYYRIWNPMNPDEMKEFSASEIKSQINNKKTMESKMNGSNDAVLTTEESIKLLTRWMVENMYDRLKVFTPGTPWNIPSSELLTNIRNHYPDYEEYRKIVGFALLNALIEVKGKKEAKRYEYILSQSASYKTGKFHTSNSKSQINENQKSPRKKISKKKIFGGIILVIIAILVTGSIAGSVNDALRYAGLTDAQKSAIKMMEDTCDSNEAMVFLQSQQAADAYHDKCYRGIDSQIQQFKQSNQK